MTKEAGLCVCMVEKGGLGCTCDWCHTGECIADRETWEDCLEGHGIEIRTGVTP